MITFFLFVFASIGLCHIFVDGVIFQPLRSWLGKNTDWWSKKASELLGCYQCTGFWSGIIVAVMLAINWLPLEIICYGFASSFLANLGANVVWLIVTIAGHYHV